MPSGAGNFLLPEISPPAVQQLASWPGADVLGGRLDQRTSNLPAVRGWIDRSESTFSSPQFKAVRDAQLDLLRKQFSQGGWIFLIA